MKVGTFGSFVVSAGAIQQGTMWVGVFRLRKYDDSFTVSSVFMDETHTEGTYPSKDEAETAAFEEGGECARREQARRRS